MSNPLVVVFGATGQQGGSVVKCLLESEKSYRIHAVTRDVTKPAAQVLKSKGVEVVQGDMSKPEDAKRLFEGADIVFAVTTFWEHRNPSQEIVDGKNLVDAAKAANIKLFVWSGLPGVSKLSGGKYTHVGHFDSKAAVTEYAKSVGIPIVEVQAAQYDQNYTDLPMMTPKKQPDGTYIFTGPQNPETLTSLIDISEFGYFVVAVIENPELAANPVVPASAQYLSYVDLAKQWSEATGRKAAYVQIPKEDFTAIAGEDFTEMLLFLQDFGYYEGKDLAQYQKYLKRPATTWAEFCRKYDWTKILDQ